MFRTYAQRKSLLFSSFALATLFKFMREEPSNSISALMSALLLNAQRNDISYKLFFTATDVDKII